MLPQLHPLQKCLARIYYGDKAHLNMPCGAGVVVDDRKLLTCAHVVKAALGLREALEQPEQLISVDFPLATMNKRVSAKVIFWDFEADIAGLEFTEEIPNEVTPVFLHKTNDLMENSIKSFGFPSGYPKGTWAKGELRGPIDSGWVEIVDSQLTGHFVQQGFSGGPVWDETLQCCIGIVVATDSVAASRTSYLMPAVVIGDKWKALSVKVAERKSRSAAPRIFPPLLPYRVDCSSQKIQLEKICENSRSDSPKPIVIVVHGNDNQAHDMFLNRLKYEFIPAIIKSNSINDIHLPWPADMNNVNDLHKRLTRSLGEKVLYDPTITCEDVQKNLASDGRIAVVDTILLTDEWMKHRGGFLESYLDYWQNWPSLNPRQNLFVFLFLTHKTPSETSVFNKIRYTLRKKQILVKISHCEFHHYPRIIAALLPELIGASQFDAEEWARTEARDYLGDDLTVVMSKIRKLYENLENIPMETLAFKLKEILTSSSGD